MPAFNSLGQIALVGIGATAAMDVWLLLLARLGVPAASFALVAWSGNISTFWRSQPEQFGRHLTDPSIRENGNFRAGFPEGLAGNQQDAWPTMQRLQVTVRVVP